MSIRGSQTRLAKNGMNALMAEQEKLLDELVSEMNRQKGTKTRDDMLMEVVRNMETRIDEARWPAQLQTRMEDMEQMMAETDPIVAKRLEEKQRATKKAQSSQGNPHFMNGMQNNSMMQNGVDYDSVDMLGENLRRQNMEAKTKSYLDKDDDIDIRRFEEHRRLEHKTEKKRKKSPEEEPIVPDPSVLAYVFNPFRMMQWSIPNVDNYRQEVDALEKQRIEKEKEAKMASDAAAIMVNASQRRTTQFQDDATDKKGNRNASRKQTTKITRGKEKNPTKKGSRDKYDNDDRRGRDSSRKKRQPTKFVKKKSPNATPKKGMTFSQHTRGISGSGISGRGSSKPRNDPEEVGGDPDDEDSEPRESRRVGTVTGGSQDELPNTRSRRMDRIDTVNTNYDGDGASNGGSKHTFQRGGS